MTERQKAYRKYLQSPKFVDIKGIPAKAVSELIADIGDSFPYDVIPNGRKVELWKIAAHDYMCRGEGVAHA